MKKTLYKVGLAVSLILIFWSCKKSDPTPVGTNSDLIAKTWKMTAFSINGGDLFATLPDCSKDDLYIYAKNGKYTHDEGATKCDSSDPQIVETATWSLQQNLLKLVYPDGSSEGYIISQLTATTLKFTYSVSVGGTNATAVVTYSPI